MTFPKRWLEDEHAASSLRDVLRADRDMEPPADAEKAVWAALVVQIGAASAGAAAAGASAKGAATAVSGAAASGSAGTGAVTAVGGGLLKSILIGTFTGIVAVSGYTALEPASPPGPAHSSDLAAPVAPGEKAPSKPGPASSAGPTSQAPVAPGPGALSTYSAEPSSAPGPASRAGAGGGEPSGVASAQAEPAGSAPVPLPGSAEERESRLREESEMLRQARAALRGGDTGGAMRLLEQARQKFPGGVLGQEREALAIETLAKSGARDAASARAAAFIQAHPQSPHAARLQVYVQP